MKKKVKEKVVLDKSTGEILSSTTEYRVPKEEDYVKTYREGRLAFKEDNVLFYMFVTIADYATYAGAKEGDGIVCIIGELRQQIASECGIKADRLKKVLTQLVTLGALRRIKTGEYQVNPYYASKGKWTDVVKARERYDIATGRRFCEDIQQSETLE